ncbi:MAG TPA: sigma 54-interacting transcriptional regulator, partial [bacterium]|nr:sigma 54-interacting transcriptional regulator [bacterium]
MGWRILVIDDEETMVRFLDKKLAKSGHQVVCHTDPRRGEAALRDGSYDVVITDLVMPEVNGLDIVRTARALPQPPQVIVMTAYGTIETAVEAMKHGAFDYITKPFTPDEIGIVLERAMQNTRLAARVAELEQELNRAGLGEVVGRSAGLRKALEQVERFAAIDGVVLITGETGTGKEVLARALHRRSPRAAGPFVAINCAAIPEQLLEAELFGCRRGAFTDADRDHPKLMQAAASDTLLLDEIGDTPPTFQVTLLRFIETRR